MLKIYKASAGSGKTFTLTVEYIKLLIINPFEYKHILAVTFTNKATAEMKSRIITQLNGIYHEEKNSNPYIEKIKEYYNDYSKNLKEGEIRYITILDNNAEEKVYFDLKFDKYSPKDLDNFLFIKSLSVFK